MHVHAFHPGDLSVLLSLLLLLLFFLSRMQYRGLTLCNLYTFSLHFTG